MAAVTRLLNTAGSGGRAVVTAGTGPVGLRAAGLLAKAGVDVTFTSRRAIDPSIVEGLQQRFGGRVSHAVMADSASADSVLEGATMLLNTGPAGVNLVQKSAWAGRRGLLAAADLNAVPPLGIEGIDVTDNAVQRDGVTVFGALGVGGLKMKIHKACIARLFERNDQVLDAETISEVAGEVLK